MLAAVVAALSLRGGIFLHFLAKSYRLQNPICAVVDMKIKFSAANNCKDIGHR